jgi:hypothetical protein
MSKIGVAIGEEFPVQDSATPPHAATDNQTDSRASPGAACGRSRGAHSEPHERTDFARRDWHHEGQRCWDADVRNQHAEWEAKKRAFKEKIRAKVHEAVHAAENRRDRANGHSRRSGAWPKAFVGLGIAALAFAIHRHKNKHAPHRPPPPDSGEPIITPPPPREV